MYIYLYIYIYIYIYVEGNYVYIYIYIYKLKGDDVRKNLLKEIDVSVLETSVGDYAPLPRTLLFLYIQIYCIYI
jgi:hypothetical protein